VVNVPPAAGGEGEGGGGGKLTAYSTPFNACDSFCNVLYKNLYAQPDNSSDKINTTKILKLNLSST